MRASDEPFYNLKRLHIVFALSAVALLAVTVWMLVADHRREWKTYQRTYRDQIEPWLTEARIRDRENGAFAAREKELLEALEVARASVPEKKWLEAFEEELQQDAARRKAETPSLDRLETAYRQLAEDPDRTAREAFFEQVDAFIAAADLRRENLERELRFRRADFDEARSTFEAAVGEGASRETLDRLQTKVDAIQAEVERLESQAQASTEHVHVLQQLRDEMAREEDDARRALADHRAELQRLRQTFAQQRPNLAKRVLGAPVIDAFGRPLAIEQIWLPELTIDYHFRDVARFDRCVTCHQAIDKTQPGDPFDPACLREETLTLKLALDGEDEEESEEEAEKTPTLESTYGLALAPRGILDTDAPTIGRILPQSPAACAGLRVGDVLLEVDGTPVRDREEAETQLLHPRQEEEPTEAESEENEEEEAWEDEEGEFITLSVRRGLPQPYCSHPRLDLYVGSLSPHPVSEFGCTICHDGQGSATAFRWASHTPNDPRQRRKWRQEHDWFHNPMWDLPMLPARLAESRCLKCHHDVTDLEPSRRFPDPPAPKLLAGYHLVRQKGCFGCHEIRGVDASGKRVGPDMRLEPNYSAAAQGLLAEGGLDARQKRLAEKIVREPERPDARRALLASLCEGEDAQQLAPKTAALLEVLAAEDPYPGTMRKLGPSLRQTAGRLDRAFLTSWIRDPADYLPERRMPELFSQHEHLEGRGLEDARRFEAVEIHAIIDYLMATSQPVAPLPAPPGVTEPPSGERGKTLFQTQGCLACHRHADFPEGQSTQGPELSRIGSKYTTPEAAAWLASWLRDPARHAPRTLMPNALLEPVPLPGEADSSTPKTTDPVADLVAYLLSKKGWKPAEVPALVEADLDELALLHLAKTFPRETAERYLNEGIPEAMASRVSGDATELIGPMSLDKKLRYVGRRTIAKRGCFGCHDIPGFEAAQPIGPALSDWGRKQETLLAFGQVHRFLEEQDSLQEDGSGETDETKDPEDADRRGFYREAIHGQRREGFLWQKLHDPRSFDYQLVQNKGYNERLTMGRFALSDQEAEQIATFVLGLVADPPAEKYVASPDRRRRAIVEGRRIMDKYACAECHTLEMERWRFTYDPEEFEDPPELPDFDFMKPRISPEQLAASRQLDRCGRGHAEVVGMPMVDEEGEIMEDEDFDGNPLYFITPWEPAVINGAVWPVGGAGVPVSAPRITRRVPPLGGAFARLLYPVVLEQAREAGAGASVVEAWGWVPPPLVREGKMVQPAWLHQYLLNPSVIRPATVLRMPQYNLSSDEAARLVDYFSAVDGVDFPYIARPEELELELHAGSRPRDERFRDAMRMVIDTKTYCAKCHLVGDFSPGDEVKTTLAPNLDAVGARIRPEYVRRWLANPKATLPYTGMPVNFPPTGAPLGQDLFKGSSLEQLDAVTELLLNYREYTSGKTSVRRMMEAGATSKPKTEGGGEK